ncbi:hypothetical protein F4808DRAFT_462552 [Astrocystis sublimbata]|nr:hypothetical protein F4808DRAFT_462552 [Astrocystis sublimbata]
MSPITFLTLSLSAMLHLTPVLAAQCGAEAYGGAGQPGQCTGAHIASASQSGEGFSSCQLAVNAACVDIVAETGGSDCSVFLYSGEGCNEDEVVNFLDCNDEGDVLQQNFVSFRVGCAT